MLSWNVASLNSILKKASPAPSGAECLPPLYHSLAARAALMHRSCSTLSMRQVTWPTAVTRPGQHVMRKPDPVMISSCQDRCLWLQDKEKGPDHHALLALADAQGADVICLQETKLQVLYCTYWSGSRACTPRSDWHCIWQGQSTRDDPYIQLSVWHCDEGTQDAAPAPASLMVQAPSMPGHVDCLITCRSASHTLPAHCCMLLCPSSVQRVCAAINHGIPTCCGVRTCLEHVTPLPHSLAEGRRGADGECVGRQSKKCDGALQASLGLEQWKAYWVCSEEAGKLGRAGLATFCRC